MSGGARDLNNMETRAVSKFSSPPPPARPKEIHAILIETLGEHSPPYPTSKTGEDLDMRKLSAKWVPKCLNADQNYQRCLSNFEIFSARYKRFPVAIGDHGRNLIISL